MSRALSHAVMSDGVARRAARAARWLCTLLPVAVGAQQPDQPRARLVGVAFDSVGMRPLANAVVRVVPAQEPSAGRVATADSSGRFVVEGLTPGRWLATALHPVLDTLELESPVAYLDIQESGDIVLELPTPSAATLVRQRCGVMVADLGVLFGYARQATDEAPMPGATVTAEWPEWTMRNGVQGIRGEQVRRVATADASGRFTLCGVPAGNVVRVVASRGADSTGILELEIDASGVTRRDLVLAAAGTVLQPPTGSAEAGFGAQRVGPATVRGAVRDINGRPLAGAIVRVLGSGNASRTDSSGAFVVRRAMIGSQMVEARAIGFDPARQLADLRANAPLQLEFTLARRQVQLDTIRVSAGRTVSPALLSLEHRMRSGVGGTFLDGDAVRRQATRFVSDALLHVNGVRVRGVSGAGQRILMRRSDGRACLPQVIVDGIPVHTGIPVPDNDLPTGSDNGEMFLDDFVSLDQVAAMEVYPRSALVPALFNAPSGCGAVVVWTKSHFGGVSVRDPRRP